MRKLLLLSSSNVHGYEYLEYAKSDITDFLSENKVSSVLFIPFALNDYQKYLKTVANPLRKWGFEVNGIHNEENPIEAVQKAKSIFVGGGNTFRLLKTLYDLKLVDPIRKRVLKDGVPYMGSSAGTNVATVSIHTTNDMPIVYPPSFKALNLVSFNINPHYQDPDESSIHKGETRQERILQYLEEEEAKPVLGLREGSTLYVNNDTALLKGLKGARIFLKGKEPTELEVGTDISHLLKE